MLGLFPARLTCGLGLKAGKQLRQVREQRRRNERRARWVLSGPGQDQSLPRPRASDIPEVTFASELAARGVAQKNLALFQFNAITFRQQASGFGFRRKYA